jgi:hypothetical protein
MSRPRKIQTNDLGELEMSDLPVYKHVLTYISKDNSFGPGGTVPLAAVSKMLNDEYALGYEVVDFRPIEIGTPPSIGVLYLLKLRDA